MASTDLAKDVEVTRPKRHSPEVILFYLYPNLSVHNIITAVQEQKVLLKGASLELRSIFVCKRGRNMAMSVDDDSIEQIASLRRLNIGWVPADFRPNRRPLV